MTTRDALEILGLGTAASEADIKQAYRDMAKVWHPDRFPNDSRLRAKAEEKLKQINEAYHILSGYRPSPDSGPRRTRERAHSGAQSPPRTEAEPTSSPPPASANRPRDAGGVRSAWPRLIILGAIVAVIIIVYVGNQPVGRRPPTRPSPLPERVLSPDGDTRSIGESGANPATERPKKVRVEPTRQPRDQRFRLRLSHRVEKVDRPRPYIRVLSREL